MNYSMRHIISLLAVVIASSSTFATDNSIFDRPQSLDDDFEPRLLKYPRENLFTGADISASGILDNHPLEIAIDGDYDFHNYLKREGKKRPGYLTIDMKQQKQFNAIAFWHGHNANWFRYKIECSQDGTNWVSVVERPRLLRAPSAHEGFYHQFEPIQARYVKFTILNNGYLTEIECYNTADTPLNGCVSSLNVSHRSNIIPVKTGNKQWSAIAWKGERVAGQFAIWSDIKSEYARLSTTDLVNQDGNVIPMQNVKACFMRYVSANGIAIPDIIETDTHIDIPSKTIRPIWLRIDVPRSANPGVYKGELTFRANRGREFIFDLNVKVINRTLPPPSQWKFWLDLYINYSAIANLHKVEPCSDEHLRILKPYLTMAAEAGQKPIMISLSHEGYYCQYHPMSWLIKRTLLADGSWYFDYTDFDRYVELAEECGIKGQISCHSMYSFGYSKARCTYKDQASGDMIQKLLLPGTPEYEEFWIPFLENFVLHLKEKQWLDRAVMWFDERPLQLIQKAIELIHKYAPGLNCGSVGHYGKELSENTRDLCIKGWNDRISDSGLNWRSERGLTTTFYTCWNPARPNTFTASPPVENVWMGWHAAARGFDGYLRWGFCNWNRDPFETTDYFSTTERSGDAWLIYPGPRSSMRFERLREGIQDFEKIRILRNELKKNGKNNQKRLDALNKLLQNFQPSKTGKPLDNVGTPEEIARDIQKGKEILNFIDE